MRRLIATATTAAVLVGGTVAAGAAVRSAGRTEQGLSPGDEQPPDRRAVLRRRVLAEAVRVAAETIGVEPAELVAAVRSGTPVAEVATQRGVDPEAVVGALVAAAEGGIERAVDTGRIGVERAATLRERAPDIAARLVDATRPPGSNQSPTASQPHASLRRRALRAAVEIAAQTIGVEPESVVRAHRAGQSVGDLATENGVLPQTVIDALVEAAAGRLDEAVARGRLDAVRASSIMERLPDLARRLVEARRSDAV